MEHTISIPREHDTAEFRDWLHQTVEQYFSVREFVAERSAETTKQPTEAFAQIGIPGELVDLSERYAEEITATQKHLTEHQDEGETFDEWYAEMIERASSLRKLNSIEPTPDRAAHDASHPSGIRCIQITEHMPYCLGSAVKWIWRAGPGPNPVEDLKKAIWYLEREISRLNAQVER